MDFKDEIKMLGDRIEKLKDQIATEEATKNAFIMPFIKALGYDVFNPLEVVPEYITDIGTKKGEKIDYAIFMKDVPTILIECKHWAQNLDLHDNQLLRYFHVSKAKFGVLTNGIQYRFYSDLVEANKMDEKPFLEFNINEIKENQVEELKKFHKSYFDIESIVNTASELKYTNELRSLFQSELANPSPEFVKFFAKQVYPGPVTAKVLEQFTNLTKKSFSQHFNDLINDRLHNAIKSGDEQIKVDLVEPIVEEKSKIVTTEEELEAFMIIKTILRQKYDIARIGFKDSVNYFAVNLDNSAKKAICRVYLNSTKKFIGLFDDDRKEQKVEISSLDDLFNHSEMLFKTAEALDKSKDSNKDTE